MSEKLTLGLAQKLLSYSSETGIFKWKERPVGMFAKPAHQKTWNKQNANREAGHKASNGYVYITVHLSGDKHVIPAQVLAWLFVHGDWPQLDIDHKNGDRRDNRISNLRLATRSQNKSNQGMSSRNTSGYKGVSRVASSGKYQVIIGVNGATIYIGRFECARCAAEAYDEAAMRHHGEFAKTNKMLGLL